MFSVYDAFGWMVSSGHDSRAEAEAEAADRLKGYGPGTKLYVVETCEGRVSRLIRREQGTDVLALD